MMKVATRSAQAGEHGKSLERLKQRFALWRKSRMRGEHIPGPLWAAAVHLVERHGLQRTAQELGVDCDRLKKRLGGIVSPARTRKAEPQFVEMFVPPEIGTQETCACIVEMENAQGGKMRVELKNLEGLSGLASAFWSVR